MNILLKENERIDDLEFKNLKIIQNKNGFCFGIDSILLTDFAKEMKPKSKVIDLGTGTGIIPILLSKKTKSCNFIGCEIQKEVALMAERSVKINNLENQIEIENIDILDLKNKFKKGYFDVVTTNPPYKKINTGLQNLNKELLISRHEVTASLEDFIDISAFLLKDFGEFYMVNRPDRLVDILCIMRNKKIEPKKIRFVYPNKEKDSDLVLIECTLNGKSGVKVMKPLYVYDKKNVYSKEVEDMFGEWFCDTK